ncbi:MAG: ROK family protein [Cryobacterium sp.]|nr:ROK family protein [Cryobacterium sp.]
MNSTTAAEPFESGFIGALDIGGTIARGGLFATDGTLLFRTEAKTGGNPGSVDPELRVCRKILRSLNKEARRRGGRLGALGAGFPEYVHRGRLRSHEVLEWTAQPVDLFRSELGSEVKIFIESDVRCGALAEASFGAGRGAESAFYLSWGTGLSSSVIIEGQIIAGARGEAIGIGEFPVPGRIDPEWTGNLERFASGKGIQERYESFSGVAVNGARDVVIRAERGEDAARLIADSAAQAMGEAIAAMVAVLDPGVVVIGGGIGSDGDGYLASRARLSYEHGSSRRPSPPPLVSAVLGSEAGLIGAALASGAISMRELASGN